MKIIFLDIDGVLNHHKTRTITRDGWCFVEDYMVQNLALIIRNTNAKIVLSSTWRIDWNQEDESRNGLCFEDLRNKFHEYGIDIMDKTGPTRHTRGQEIEEWLANWDWNKEPIEHFVIIDDMADIAPFQANFIQTDPSKGLTFFKAQEIINFLNI